MRLLRLVLCVAWLASGGAAAAETLWYTISAEGEGRIGHAFREIIARPDGREIVDYREIRLSGWESGASRTISRTTRREDSSGRVVAIVAHEQSGRRIVRTDVRIVEGKAEIVRQTGDERVAATVPLSSSLRFDGGEALLAAWDPKASPRIEFDSLDIGAGTVERVAIEPAPAAPEDPPGTRAALRTRYEAGELRSLARLLIDPQGRIVSVAQPMFGTAIVTRLADRSQALRPHPAYSALRGAMVKSQFRISPRALGGRIRYRFGFAGGLAFGIPETPEQKVTREGDSALVDICRGCGTPLADDAASLAAALRPTAWLQSDHERLRAIAAPVARMEVSGRRRMELLAGRALPYLGKIDFNGHYSALETLSRRAGDCTEAAVLLAALGRAAGIPTKVVNGLVYSREAYHGVGSVFMPHSWTLAYVDGKWESFDLALFAFDASHIALTIGDGDPGSIAAAAQLAGLLRWDGMSEVRKRAAE